MTGQTLKDLSEAAHHLSVVSEALAETDCPDPGQLQMAQLAGVSGCFTTLVQIAASLHNLETGLLFANVKKGVLQ